MTLDGFNQVGGTAIGNVSIGNATVEKILQQKSENHSRKEKR